MVNEHKNRIVAVIITLIRPCIVSVLFPQIPRKDKLGKFSIYAKIPGKLPENRTIPSICYAFSVVKQKSFSVEEIKIKSLHWLDGQWH